MESRASSVSMKLALLLSLATVALCSPLHNDRDFDVFYFVQQWLTSYCNQAGTRCCYPPTGKIKPDFTIDGLWPFYNDGTFPYNCAGANYDVAPLKPLQDQLRKEWPSYTCPQIGRKFWLHEWNKHGTCSATVMGEMAYFHTALNLKKKINLLQILEKAGIKPNNQFYPLKAWKRAIFRATGFKPWVTCNHNAQGHSQIWQISLCVDRTGTKLTPCPIIPKGRNGCADRIQFPSH